MDPSIFCCFIPFLCNRKNDQCDESILEMSERLDVEYKGIIFGIVIGILINVIICGLAYIHWNYVCIPRINGV